MAVTVVSHNDVPKIGQLLVQRNVISSDQLDIALDEQRRSGGKLGEILVNKKLVSEAELNTALVEQFRLKLAAVLLAFGTSLLPVTTVHGDDTSHLLLIGKVAPANTVSVADNTAQIDFNGPGQSASGSVAHITERSNNLYGYSVLLEAKNVSNTGQPLLTNSGNPADKVPYKLTYDGHDVYFIDGAAVISDTPGASNVKPVTKELHINADNFGDIVTSAYSDTLTLVVVVK